MNALFSSPFPLKRRVDNRSRFVGSIKLGVLCCIFWNAARSCEQDSGGDANTGHVSEGTVPERTRSGRAPASVQGVQLHLVLAA
jgi:hypothetical protein